MLLRIASNILNAYPRINQSISYRWRQLATGISFGLFGMGALFIGGIFITLYPLPISRLKKQYWARHTISFACRLYIKMMKLMGLLTYSLPMKTADYEGCLIIANHPTLLDAIFVLATNNNLCCIMKSTLWKHPATAIIARIAGYIPNNTDSFIELVTKKLKNNESILIFPEGTRNNHDLELNFKRGAANIAIIAQRPIIPITIHCRPRTLQKNERWYQIPKTPPHFIIEVLEPIFYEHVIDTQKPRTIQYRHLTKYLKTRYKQTLSQPIRTPT